ncbi:MAG TPA: hypothetical protein VFB00_05765 [Terriglobales bacterium]|nr:hypothetical protein [Terriglobales bacterium]
MSASLRYLLLAMAFCILVCALAVVHLPASASGELPHVELQAESAGPRSMEDLTSKSVHRDYALAWQSMERALEENRAGLLDAYFTGFAKQDLTERVKSQIQSGLQTRYQDRGHKLDAVFYAPAGDAMQLRDRAQFDIQVLDGGKVIYEAPVSAQFIVLMTPGADRWLVRQIQAIPGEKP